MKQKFLRLNATTHGDRHRMIELAKDAIGASGGWILDFTIFSNVSICLNFELQLGNVARLREALEQTELQLSDASLQALDGLAGSAERQVHPVSSPSINSPTDVIASLQITFIHNEPDLRIPVPMIPG